MPKGIYLRKPRILNPGSTPTIRYNRKMIAAHNAKTSSEYYVIKNKHTQKYYRNTFPCTELHIFDDRRGAAVYSMKEWAIKDAIKIRGRYWERFLEVMLLRCRPRNVELKCDNWRNRIESEEVA